MPSAFVVLAAALLLHAPVRADDIVFSAARLRSDHGCYFPVDTPHLYFMHSDGSGLRQITTGDFRDTEPCPLKDGKSIVFYRTGRYRLAGDRRLCSVWLDGSHLKTLRSDPEDSDNDADSKKKTPLRPRPLHANDEPDDTPSIPSSEGGSDTAIDVASVGDGTYVCGFGEAQPWGCAIFTKSGHISRRIDLYHVQDGKRHLCQVFGNEQWAVNSEGALAFRPKGRPNEIVLQEVARTNDGGDPAIYCFSSRTGQVRYEIGEEFLQDVDADRSHFLTTTWEWGGDPDADGTVPLADLNLWDAVKARFVHVGPHPIECLGACFVRSGASK